MGNSTRPAALLAQWKVLDWPAVTYGWQAGLMTQREIVDYAVRSVVLGDEHESAILLASADNYESDELDELIRGLAKIPDTDLSRDKWRLAVLTEISDSAADDEKKLARLQRAYADFGYPDDMRACSIYEQEEVGPLEQMRKLIVELSEQLIPKERVD